MVAGGLLLLLLYHRYCGHLNRCDLIAVAQRWLRLVDFELMEQDKSKCHFELWMLAIDAIRCWRTRVCLLSPLDNTRLSSRFGGRQSGTLKVWQV